MDVDTACKSKVEGRDAHCVFEKLVRRGKAAAGEGGLTPAPGLSRTPRASVEREDDAKLAAMAEFVPPSDIETMVPGR